ncbi:oligomeric complex COG6 [Hesseltinella vesiculosa]|uniref:Conserved oligomeric Golgi complex subunit 6 n=1 Tax=Hesseltinella vesiculosa TaxID=101127 RepID=A0A1X2G2Q6_9FUNG|nr:oligomeric complex COG6 [Hesseltinella vesiculosa]
MESTSPPLSSEQHLPSFVSNKPNKVVAAKLQKVLHASMADDTRIKDALTALSDIPDLNQADLRRNLRGTIEKKEIQVNQKFLDAFSLVVNQLNSLETQVQNMQSACQQMRERLGNVTSETAKMIEQASVYETESAACDARVLLAKKFLDKFTLSQEEVQILTSNSSPVNGAFFDALDHLQRIHNDCRLLLTSTHQQTGIQIMESLSLHQEAAYDKLYRWTQLESRSSFGGDSIDVSSLMTKALYSLRHRPVLFRTILDEISMARREAVGHAFMTALTRGGPGGTPRPIELQAHDSLRYIGDMLAWVHQACAGEKELLEALFKNPSLQKQGKSSDDYEDVTVTMIKEAVDDLLDAAMEGTCRPLKIRMDQVLGLHPDVITCYKVANLIHFYAITMTRLLRKDSSLSKTLYAAGNSAGKYLYQTLNAQSQRILQNVETPPKTLAVSSTVRDVTHQLKEIIGSYDSSLVMSNHASNEDLRDFNFDEILDIIIEPLTQACEMSSAMVSRVDGHIYVLNCLHYFMSTMAVYPFTEQKYKTLESKVNDRLDALAQEQYQELLQHSGLASIVNCISSKQKDIPLSTLSGMDARSLTTTLSKLDSSLVMASADISPQMQRLRSSEHCQQIQEKAIHRLLESYRLISEAVQDPANDYGPDSASILPRSVEDMEAIFSFAL